MLDTKDMTRSLVVFGDQTADEIVSAAREVCADQFETIRKFVFTDQIDQNAEFLEFVAAASETFYILGMIDARLKPKVNEFAQNNNMTPYSVIHPTAYVAPSATIGEGTFIAPQAVVAVNAKVGSHSLVHIHSSVGHDCQIGDYCAILPGARISGHVVLEDGVMIGSNAFVFQGVRVGFRSQVDALTYVRNDVEPKRIVSCRAQM